jgi:hypothetical protein
MLGLKLDYYVEVNMAGFAAIIDALGGLNVDVGPEPLPVGGITPTGRHVKPDRYIPAGPQHLDGTDTLAVARSRTNSDDYTRWAGSAACSSTSCSRRARRTCWRTSRTSPRPRRTACRPTSPSRSFRRWSRWPTGAGSVALESVSFDPNLADPNEADGRFDTSRPDVAFMKKVVRDTIAGPPPTAAPRAAPTSAPSSKPPSASAKSRATADEDAPTTGPPGADGGRHLPRAIVLNQVWKTAPRHTRPGAVRAAQDESVRLCEEDDLR